MIDAASSGISLTDCVTIVLLLYKNDTTPSPHLSSSPTQQT